MQAGLHRALLGAGCVAVGEGLESPLGERVLLLLLLMVKVVPGLGRRFLRGVLRRKAGRRGAVPGERGAQVHLGDGADQLLHCSSRPGQRDGAGGRGLERRGARRGGRGRRGARAAVLGGGPRGPLALRGFAVGVVAAVLSARVFVAGVRVAADRRHPAQGTTGPDHCPGGRQGRLLLVFLVGPLGSFLLH